MSQFKIFNTLHQVHAVNAAIYHLPVFRAALVSGERVAAPRNLPELARF